ncbi:MAG TPA: hypothetical protein ENG42_02565 [Candidatus Aenigmarchaeota archaeon]|nr:MAG: hypothetical protein DRP03_02635 [Candidatus Aenigmarchaeota archaeon]HDD46332.1 hypothetical protein [Candidatus Aenigmarchaeota archaeon]
MKGKELRAKIFKIIEMHWPVHIKEIARELEIEIDNTAIKKISYHLKQLEKAEKIRTKRIGKALVAWPTDMEKLRVLYEFLKE